MGYSILFAFICGLNSKPFIMGRGDKRTKKGKIFKGSFGNSRPARIKSETVVAVVKETSAKPAKKAAAPKKAAAKKKAE